MLKDAETMVGVQKFWHERMDDQKHRDPDCLNGVALVPYSTRLISQEVALMLRVEREKQGVVTQMREDHPPFTVERTNDHVEFIRAMRLAALDHPLPDEEDNSLLLIEARAYGDALRDASAIPLWTHRSKGIPNGAFPKNIPIELPWYKKYELIPTTSIPRAPARDALGVRANQINQTAILLKSRQGRSGQYDQATRDTLEVLTRVFESQELKTLRRKVQATARRRWKLAPALGGTISLTKQEEDDEIRFEALRRDHLNDFIQGNTHFVIEGGYGHVEVNGSITRRVALANRWQDVWEVEYILRYLLGRYRNNYDDMKFYEFGALAEIFADLGRYSGWQTSSIFYWRSWEVNHCLNSTNCSPEDFGRLSRESRDLYLAPLLSDPQSQIHTAIVDLKRALNSDYNSLEVGFRENPHLETLDCAFVPNPHQNGPIMSIPWIPRTGPIAENQGAVDHSTDYISDCLLARFEAEIPGTLNYGAWDNLSEIELQGLLEPFFPQALRDLRAQSRHEAKIWLRRPDPNAQPQQPYPDEPGWIRLQSSISNIIAKFDKEFDLWVQGFQGCKIIFVKDTTEPKNIRGTLYQIDQLRTNLQPLDQIESAVNNLLKVMPGSTPDYPAIRLHLVNFFHPDLANLDAKAEHPGADNIDGLRRDLMLKYWIDSFPDKGVTLLPFFGKDLAHQNGPARFRLRKERAPVPIFGPHNMNWETVMPDSVARALRLRFTGGVNNSVAAASPAITDPLSTPLDNIPTIIIGRSKDDTQIPPPPANIFNYKEPQKNVLPSDQLDFTSMAERRGIKRAAIQLALNLFATNQEQHRPNTRFRRVILPTKWVSPIPPEVPVSLALEPTKRPVELDTLFYTKLALEYERWKDHDYNLAVSLTISERPGEIFPPRNYNGPITIPTAVERSDLAARYLEQLTLRYHTLKYTLSQSPRPLLLALIDRIETGMIDQLNLIDRFNAAIPPRVLPPPHPAFDIERLTTRNLEIFMELAELSWHTEDPEAYPNPVTEAQKRERRFLEEFEQDVFAIDIEQIPFWTLANPAGGSAAPAANTPAGLTYEQPPYGPNLPSATTMPVGTLSAMIRAYRIEKIGVGCIQWSDNEVIQHLQSMHAARRI